ncbi:MAG: thiolase family protein [Anaerolineales bacterium]|nr:MAG: thiolase family protein [Anaerolineales bacterium]
MALENVYIPYGGYWSTPFCKWQGSFANLHPVTFAADVARQALQERDISPKTFTSLYFGMTIPSKYSFYGAPWVAGLIGAAEITGPVFAQACATSARVLGSAAYEVESGASEQPVILCLTTDRTSNGPHLLYPNPFGPGGRGDAEDWVWDNFNLDPFARNSMIQTAENVARDYGITTEEQHQVVLMRHAQYQQSLADEAAFQKRYMVSPVEINPSGRKVIGTVNSDEGIFPTTADGLARLKPVLPEGTVTFGGQTFPADGNAAMVVTTRSSAREISSNPAIEVRLRAFAEGRAPKGYMPKANAPAIHEVLQRAGIALEDVKAIKTHNPFAVNDIFLSREFGIPLEGMNNYGSSLIWGHPQGPTGMRLIIELIEELVSLGGGYGLFSGCAAGDTAAAVVVEVIVD